jgi:hypothetical protein
MIRPSALLVAAALLYAGCASGPAHAPAGQPPLATIAGGDLAAFQKAFNDAGDTVRLIVLLAPT